MTTALDPSHYRILALDVDGTILDRDGRLRPETAAAIARASIAGLRPVLCTGRRYRTARPVADDLGLVAPIVCNSGAIVKDATDHSTFWRADFDGSLLGEILGFAASEGVSLISFSDRDPAESDFVVDRDPSGDPLFDEFVARNRPHAEVAPGWMAEPSRTGPHFHLCAIGDRPGMLDLEGRLHSAMPGRLRTFVQRSPRYRGTLCELLHPSASKWSAVRHLAGLWGVEPGQIIAVGDDMNDLPMIEGAGLGVAMGHAPRAVLDAADLVVPDHEGDGVTHLLNRVLGI